jgi:hypothetical protein
MALALNLENPENWQTRDSQLLLATPGALLPEYVSVELNSNIIAVLVDNAEALESWHSAGWLAQKINLPVGPNSIPARGKKYRLWLREKQLFILKSHVTRYQITVRFPRWFNNASITLWEYQNLIN